MHPSHLLHILANCETQEKESQLNVNITNVNETRREIEIAVTLDELAPRFEEAYREYQPKVNLKGFRKGRVPLPIVKRLYGEAIEHDTVDKLIDDFYRQALEERNIKPVGKPVVIEHSYDRGAGARFKIHFEVTPEFELKGYKGIRVEKRRHTLSEEEVDHEVLRLRRANAITTPAEAATDDQFIVTADVQELDHTGFPVIGRKDKNVRFYLGGEDIDPELRDALMAARTGEERRVTLKSKHGDHEHETNLLLKVTSVAKFELPPFDDAFVDKVTKGKHTNVPSFLVMMRRDLAEYWESEAERRVDDAIVGELVRRHEFQPPDAVVDALLKSYVEDYAARQPGKKLLPDFDEEKFRSETRPRGVFQAKWILIRDRIIEAEHLVVDDEDVAALAEKESARMGIDRQRLVEFYKKSEQTRERILSGKITAFLRKHAEVTEVEEKDTPSLTV